MEQDYGEASLNETAAGEIGRAFGMNEGKGIEGREEKNGKYEAGQRPWKWKSEQLQ